MRYAIYTRVSRSDQHHACEAQRIRLEEYAKTHDMEVVERYADVGVVTTKGERPGLKAMIADYEAGKFDKVLVVNYDRLSRKAEIFPFPVVSEVQGEIDYSTIQMLDVIRKAMRVSNLSAYRHAAGMSQRELAEISGVSVGMIRHYEQGVKDINSASAITVYRLAHALDCEVADILELQDEPLTPILDEDYHESEDEVRTEFYDEPDEDMDE